MFATDNLIILAIVLVLIWNGMTLLQFVMLLYYKFRFPTFEIIHRDEIGIEITEMIKPLEDFLYAEGFRYQSVLKHDGPMVGADHDYYKFYYYHEEEGIHAYIDTQPFRGALQSARITYETIYQSKNICTTADGIDYALPALPDSVYFFDHYYGDNEKVYQSHLKDRLQEGEVILKEAFSPDGLKAYMEYSEALYVEAYQKAGYVRLTSYGYRFAPSIKLWEFSKQMVKGYKRYHKVLTQEKAESATKFVDKKGQVHSLLMQLDAMAKPRGESNKMLWFIGSMVAFMFLFELFGFSLLDIGLLVIVLLIHELGHFLAMRYFGYTDTNIFFLPFGAATVGKKSKKSAFEEYIVYLAGPLPGIVIGIVLLFSVMSGSPLNSGLVNTYAIMSIVINYLNLLPIYPLDGGRIMQILFLLRYPRAQFYFYLTSLAVIIFAMIWFQDYILLIFVVILGLAFKQNYYISELMAKLLKKKEKDGIEKVDVATVLVEDEQYRAQSLTHKANIAKQVIEILHTSKPSKWLAGFGFAFYLLLLLPPVLPLIYTSYLSAKYAPPTSEIRKESNSLYKEGGECRKLTQTAQGNLTIVL